MSYYDVPAQAGGAWQNARPGWDTRSNSSGGGAAPPAVPFQRQYPQEPAELAARPPSVHLKNEEPAAFGSQLDEVDRAVDNLVKSGKMFGGGGGRRESMPLLGAAAPQQRSGPMHRNYSAAGPAYEEVMRSQSAANLQSYYATQRFAPRPAEMDQMVQAKRRLAAQRERELRNFHQEQQYNRTTIAEMANFNGKERVVSPGTMSEDDRRELIARQHRALYGEQGEQEQPLGPFDLHGQRASGPPSTAGSVTGGTRGPSPLAFDPFGYPNGNQQDGLVQTPVNEHPGALPNGMSPGRSRTNSVSSPSNKSYSAFNQELNKAAQSSRTSASSPGGSPPKLGRVSTTPVTNSGVAPIGTRPMSSNQIPPGPGLQKRSTTPIPSPLGYNNYQAPGEESYNTTPGSNKPLGNERSASAASNHTTSSQDPSNMAWGKVWGSKGLGTVASVWG